MKAIPSACLAIMIASIGTVASGQTIRIPLGAQGSTVTEQGLPERGTSSERVLAALGEPLQRNPPVGQPPIERWDYADFSVYFESGQVVHSVLGHRHRAMPE